MEDNIQQQTFELELRELASQAIKLIDDKREETSQKYLDASARIIGTNTLDRNKELRQLVKRLDFFNKALDTLKRGIEIAVRGDSVKIDEEN